MTPQADILSTIEPEIAARLTSRRDLFSRARLKLGAAATVPLLLAATSSDVFAQAPPQQVTDILNFALTLEYLESEFYRQALASPGLIPDQYRTVFQTISKHEDAHVLGLNVFLAGAAIRKPAFDFTARGQYPDIFRNFKTFAAVSQTLEDTGVAAYKGQAPGLMGHTIVLRTALEIHSVEARHAAEVRIVRGVKPSPVAFDAPLSKAQVLARAAPFIASLA